MSIAGAKSNPVCGISSKNQASTSTGGDALDLPCSPLGHRGRYMSVSRLTGSPYANNHWEVADINVEGMCENQSVTMFIFTSVGKSRGQRAKSVVIVTVVVTFSIYIIIRPDTLL